MTWTYTESTDKRGPYTRYSHGGSCKAVELRGMTAAKVTEHFKKKGLVVKRIGNVIITRKREEATT